MNGFSRTAQKKGQNKWELFVYTEHTCLHKMIKQSGEKETDIEGKKGTKKQSNKAMEALAQLSVI
jgi:hypothetical protein